MTTGYTAPLGAPIWIDLSSSDIDRAQDFYSTIFGWTFESAGPDYGGYLNASKNGNYVRRPDVQRSAMECAGRLDDVLSHVGYPCDGESRHRRRRNQSPASGRAPSVEPMEVPEKGWMAMGTDPSGAAYGLWQPTGHRGFEVIGEHGAPVWHQLTTRDYAKALDFYRAVLGWDTQVESDTDEFRYSTALFDGEPILGVMDGSAILPEQTPSQ